ncbi:MAG: hypothetical protein H6850_00720 [Alphaproteobacteria bacterium]|nr:MAG: hypothetical protein H6850_00720 [Alphaproteobacteria bacterium]
MIPGLSVTEATLQSATENSIVYTFTFTTGEKITSIVLEDGLENPVSTAKVSLLKTAQPKTIVVVFKNLPREPYNISSILWKSCSNMQRILNKTESALLLKEQKISNEKLDKLKSSFSFSAMISLVITLLGAAYFAYSIFFRKKTEGALESLKQVQGFMPS